MRSSRRISYTECAAPDGIDLFSRFRDVTGNNYYIGLLGLFWDYVFFLYLIDC